MSDQHKYTIVSNDKITAYVMDKTSGSELVVIDRRCSQTIHNFLARLCVRNRKN